MNGFTDDLTLSASAHVTRCWGATEFGQDGHGAESGSEETSEGCHRTFENGVLGVLPAEKVKFTACGASHSVVITESDRIFTWGNGTVGQLGCGKKVTQRFPLEIKIVKSIRRYKKSAAHHIETSVEDKNEINSPQNGIIESEIISNEDNIDNSRITGLTTESSEITNEGDAVSQDVIVPSNGEDSGIALCSGIDKTIEDAGGVPATDDGDGDGVDKVIPEDKESLDLPLSPVAGVSCGGRHTIIWLADGTVYSYGNNFFAQLGYDFQLESYKDNQWKPQLMNPLTHKFVQKVACGEKHSVFLFDNGTVGCVGNNSHGQIGDGSEKDADVVKVVEDVSNVVSISCGAFHTVTIDDVGSLLVWGYAKACGRKKEDYLSPHVLTSQDKHPGGPRFVDVQCGQQHNLAISANGNCYSWGFGTYGQLGHGEEETFLSLPKRLPHEQLSRNVARVSCGENYSTAITDEGKLYFWGKNSHVIKTDQPANQKTYTPTLVNFVAGSSNGDGNQEMSKVYSTSSSSAGEFIPVMSVVCGAWHVITVDGKPRITDWHLSRDDDAESCELFEDVITRPQSKDEQIIPSAENGLAPETRLPSIYSSSLQREKTKLTIAEFYAPTPDVSSVVSGPRQSVCSTDGDGGSTRTKSRVSQRSSVTLPALENSTEPEMEAEEAPEKEATPQLSHNKDMLCHIEPSSKQMSDPIVPKVKSVKPIPATIIRRKRAEFVPASSFVSKTLADQFALPREKSFLSNQNIVLPCEESALSTSATSRAANNNGTAMPGNHQIPSPRSNNSRTAGWTAADRQKTMVQLTGQHGAGSRLSNRAAMVALQRSRTLTSFSASSIGNHQQQLNGKHPGAVLASSSFNRMGNRPTTRADPQTVPLNWNNNFQRHKPPSRQALPVPVGGPGARGITYHPLVQEEDSLSIMQQRGSFSAPVHGGVVDKPAPSGPAQTTTTVLHPPASVLQPLTFEVSNASMVKSNHPRARPIYSSAASWRTDKGRQGAMASTPDGEEESPVKLLTKPVIPALNTRTVSQKPANGTTNIHTY